MNSIKWWLGLRHCLAHDGKGKCAGIALYWDDSIKIKVLLYGSRYFDVFVSEHHGTMWRGTFVYGEPKSQDRHHMWRLLRDIAPHATEPCMMIGDLNKTMWQHEHFSCSKRSESNIDFFRDLLSWCNLHDLRYCGPDWTYDNKQQGRKKSSCKDWKRDCYSRMV